MIRRAYNKIQAHSSFKKYFSNTSWLIGERMFRIILTSLVGILLVRHLQPENYGKLSFAISFISLFTAFTSLGLDNFVIKYFVNFESRKKNILGTAFLLKLFGGICALICIAVWALLSTQETETKLLTFTVGLSLIFQSFNVADFYFQSQTQAKYGVMAQIVSVIVVSILKLVLIFLNAPLLYFGIAYTLEIIVVALFLSAIISNKGAPLFEWSFKFSLAKELLTQSWPLILSSIMVSLYMKIDQVMIQSLLDSTQTGLYSAAVNISEVWYFIPVMIVNSLYPALITTRKNQKLFELRFKQLNTLLLICAFAAIISVSFLSEFIIRVLYGETYLPAAAVLFIHIWSAIFVFLGVIATRWLIIEKLQFYSTVITTIGAIINISLNFILIPKIGIVGAAWATLIAYAFSGFICFSFFKATRKYFILQIKSVISPTLGFLNA